MKTKEEIERLLLVESQAQIVNCAIKLLQGVTGSASVGVTQAWIESDEALRKLRNEILELREL